MSVLARSLLVLTVGIALLVALWYAVQILRRDDCRDRGGVWSEERAECIGQKTAEMDACRAGGGTWSFEEARCVARIGAER